jgi:LPXTG-motif cell wall-anchored protein
MAAICRVLSSLCRGFIVVLLACLVGLAVPASAVAETTPAPTPTAAGDPASAPPLAQPGDQATSAESSAAEPSSAAPSSPAPAATADAPEDPVPAFTLALTSDQPRGALVWADDELGYELTGTNTGDSGIDVVTIRDDLTGVLQAATVDADPAATITHRDGSAEPTTAALSRTTLTWTGHLDVGETVRISYAVTVGLVAKATTLHNVARATWTAADGSTQVSATAEASNPVNPVAIDDSRDGSGRGSTGTLANTGVEDAASLLAFAGLLLLFGISLVAIRRRQ